MKLLYSTIVTFLLMCFHLGFAEMSMMDMAVMTGSQYGTSSVIHKATAVYYASKCGWKSKHYCYLAMLAAGQAISDGGKSKESFNVAETIAGNGPLFGTDHTSFEDYCSDSSNSQSSMCSYDGTAYDNAVKKPPLSSGDLGNIKQATGVSFDQNTGTALDKNGNKVDLLSGGAGGLDGSLSKMGLNSGQIAGIKSHLDKVGKSVAAKLNKQKDKVKMDLALGGASGGSSINNTNSLDLASLNEDENAGVNFNDLWNSMDKDGQDKFKNKQMKKMIGNNEAVGVSADNLFKMIDRRYKSLDKSRIFVK